MPQAQRRLDLDSARFSCGHPMLST